MIGRLATGLCDEKDAAPLRFIEPMECLPVGKIPEGAEWQYELKLDAYRSIAVKDGGDGGWAAP